MLKPTYKELFIFRHSNRYCLVFNVLKLKLCMFSVYFNSSCLILKTYRKKKINVFKKINTCTNGIPHLMFQHKKKLFLANKETFNRNN